MRLSKILFGLALVVLVIELLLISPQPLGRRSALASKETINSPTMPGQAVTADQAIKGVNLIETRGGQREWELNADSALEFRGKGTWDVEKIRTKFFGNKGIQFLVKGQKGQVSVDSKDMVIEGDVITRTSNNYELKSDTIVYSASERQLSSDSPVRILGPKDKNANRLQLRGLGMQALVGDGKIEILDKVSGDVSLGTGTPVHIKSKSVELSSSSKAATFKGNVIIDVESLRVTGPRAEFQYGTNGDELTSVFVEGGVKVSDVDKWATSENVKVVFKENKFVFKGRPRLVKENDELFGDEIVFLNGGKKVQVKGAKAEIDSSHVETN